MIFENALYTLFIIYLFHKVHIYSALSVFVRSSITPTTLKSTVLFRWGEKKLSVILGRKGGYYFHMGIKLIFLSIFLQLDSSLGVVLM